jgi:transcriptional regulator with XRE-family HTH domain
MDVRQLGTYIRDQRKNGGLSLRGLSGLAGVSIPYLSQVERGLRKPSADILQAIAKGLRVSAETLYIQAGILEDRPGRDVAAAIMSDGTITERQKQALVQIYEAFREETSRAAAVPALPAPPADGTTGRSRTAKRSTGSGTRSTKRTTKTTPKEV